MSSVSLRVLPVLATPFDGRLNIELDTLCPEIDWLFANGIDDVVVGMVSGIQRITIDERESLNEACHYAGGQGATDVSVGAESSSHRDNTCRRRTVQ